MARKSSNKKEAPDKRKGKLSNGSKLVCDECGLTLVVGDACSSDTCSPVMCCDEEMRVCQEG